MPPDFRDRITASLGIEDTTFSGEIVAVEGRETVSQPFSYRVELFAVDLAVDELRGKRAEVLIKDLNGDERVIAGRIARARLALMTPDRAGQPAPAQLEIVPDAFAVLNLRSDQRIFQNLSVPDIVKKLSKETGLPPSLFDWSRAHGSYKARTYCAQMNETTWDFVCRLLEAEGIWFWFEGTPDGAVMTFCDDVKNLVALPAPLEFAFDPETTGHKPCVWNFRERAALVPATVKVNDYERTKPALPLDVTQAAAAQPLVARTHDEYPGGFFDPDAAKKTAKVRLDEQQGARVTFSASTGALVAQPGRRLTLEGHPRADGDWFVRGLSFALRLRDVGDETPLIAAGPPRLDLTIEGGRVADAWRPPRATAVPRMIGFQTARVTGPAGQEIECDEHARVKLKFPWDRDGALDEKSSRWVPVLQVHNTGAIMIPRVGWEVLVGYEFGDPDRPLCFGRVWNPFAPPPTTLPAGKTETHLSSTSSPGGAGVNQVVFDDTAGSESVLVAAHKNAAVTVAHDKLWKVGHNLDHTVSGARTVQISSNESIFVGANFDDKVVKNQTTSTATQEIKVEGQCKEEITSNLDRSVGGIEKVQVGNPLEAVLEVVAAKVVAAAAGRATEAIGKIAGKLTAPLKPVLKKVSDALGPAADLMGATSAVMGGGGLPTAVELALKPDKALAKGIETASDHASAFVEAVALDEFARAGINARAGQAPKEKKGEGTAAAGGNAGGGAGAGGGGGGAGAGADAAPEGALAASSGGHGTWSTIVGGDVTESIGGAVVLNSGSGLLLAIGGDSREIIGAARAELAKSKSEETGGSKIETVGAAYIVNAKESITLSAGAASAVNIAGTQRQTIKGSYSLSADGPVLVTGPQMKLKAKESITLQCGDCKVVVNSDGILISGASKVTIEGKPIKLNESALG